MGFPVDAGSANYSASGANNDSKFIPEKWSGKLLQKFYDACVYTEIANTDYEGEIKDYGDKVYIRTRPSITVTDYVKGAGLTYEEPESENVELVIDKGKSFSFKLFKIDEHQSDINLMSEWAEDGAEQVKTAVDTDILASIPSLAAAENAGATAGRKTAGINLGVAASPVALTKTNVIDYLIRCNVVMDEQNLPNQGRWIVIPASMGGIIKTSDLKDASLSGDSKSPLRTGVIGAIDRTNIFMSNLVNVSGGEYDIIFGHKSALTFAGQISHMEEIPDPNDFGKLARSLFVFGYEVIKPEALGHGVVSVTMS
jgi:hypothetical protein